MVVITKPQTVLVPVQRGGPPIAPLLPIQRRAVRARPVRRLRTVALAVAVSLLTWAGIVAAVVALGHTL